MMPTQQVTNTVDPATVDDRN